MPSDANQSSDPRQDGSQPLAGSGSEANQGPPPGSAEAAEPGPPPLPYTKPNHSRLAGAALVVACFSLVFVLVWLANNRPDPRNTPEILLAASPSTNTSDLPQLSEFKTELSSADLAFGEQQVALMVKDRPALARYVSKTDAVWQFCARAFGGQAIGERIFWENSLPGGDYQSDHQGPYEGKSGYIRIRKNYSSGGNWGQPLTCEELWSCAVFEIENIRNHKAFTALYEMALKGELSREEWIRENSRLEYGALRRTAEDYGQLWVPLEMTRSLPTTRAYWGGNCPPPFEIWISQYRDPDSYPWDVFGQYYDQQIVPYVRRNKQFQGLLR